MSTEEKSDQSHYSHGMGSNRYTSAIHPDMTAIRQWLIALLAERLGLQSAEIDVQLPFASYGISSGEALSLSADLEDWLNRSFEPTLLWDYPTIDDLSHYLAGSTEPSPIPLTSSGKTHQEPVAIVGIGCRFPGASSPQDFWQLLCNETDAITEVPADRWSASEVSKHNGLAGLQWGGFLSEIHGFDADFFDIAPREAVRVDPQQRLVLEVAWEALDDGGHLPRLLKKTKTGVFIGVSTSDYGTLQWQDYPHIDPYVGTGSALSIVANRLSYFLDLNGPSVVVDTACSSSLVAIHLACQSLQSGESTLAIAGGVNVILSPAINTNFSQAGLMAQDGRCKTFDARADGYVRSEGCGMVVLKSLSKARADSDRIYAVIRGSAVNHDGRTNGLMSPNSHSQEALLREAYAHAQVDPNDVQYVEAHGTGTFLGDLIEFQSLAQVFGVDRPADAPCTVGSVKTNIGHLEAGAGVAGLIKVALSMKHQTIPASLHFKTPNPELPLDKTSLRVQNTTTPWPATPGARLAGVSSFGFGGTNCHIVLEGVDLPEPQYTGLESGVDIISTVASPYVLPLSANSPDALTALAQTYRTFLADSAASERSLYDICYTASVRRSHLDHRLTLIANDYAELDTALDTYIQGNTHPRFLTGSISSQQVHKIVFVFPGHGGQWLGMAQQLLRTEPAFHAAVAECDRFVQEIVGWSVIQEFIAPPESSQLARVDVVQVVLFTLQVGLVALWRLWGVNPSAVIGHSMGEVAAAHVAGILSLEDALYIICQRSLMLRRVSGQGGMLATELSFEQAHEFLIQQACTDRVSVAVNNGANAAVLSGDIETINQLTRVFETQQRFCRQVKIGFASHSPQMDQFHNELIDTLADIQHQPATVPFYSTVTGELLDSQTLTTAYWWKNLRDPVLFASSVEQALKDKYTIFIELSPHPILTGAIIRCAKEQQEDTLVLPSLHRDESDLEVLSHTIGALYTVGYAIDWRQRYAQRGQSVDLPQYPWQRKRHWVEPITKHAAYAYQPLIDTASNESLVDMYALTWQLQDRRQPSEQLISPHPWLIFADTGKLGQRLAELFTLRGEQSILIGYQSDQHYCQHMVNLGQLQDGQALLCDLFADSQLACQGIIYLWGLEASPSAQLDDEALEEAQRRGCISVLHLIQSLATIQWSVSPCLWLITQGTQTIESRSTDVSLSQAPLWGFGQTIALEYPNLWGGLVDISPDSDDVELTALLDELCAPDGEDQIVLRKRDRYVARLTYSDVPATPVAPYQWKSDGTYLITGGLGAIGLQMARWMVSHGARRIVLLGRRQLLSRRMWAQVTPEDSSFEQIEAIRAMEASGATVIVVQADLTNRVQMTEILDRLEQMLPPICGIIHAAGLLDQTLLRDMDAETLVRMLRPKVLGTWILHDLTQHLPIDCFILFSSISSVWGGVNLGHYAAANRFLDTFVHYRRRQGLAATSINWGVWAEGGMAASEENAQALQRLGTISFSPQQALRTLDYLLTSDILQQTVALIDWPHFKGIYESLTSRHIFAQIHIGSAETSQTSKTTNAIPVLADISAEERYDHIQSYLQQLIAKVLRLPVAQLNLTQSLSSVGLDSLMAIEVKHHIETDLGLNIPLVQLLQGIDVKLLSEHISDMLDQPKSSEASTDIAPSVSDINSYTLSFGQKAMWFLYKLAPNSTAYNVAGALRIYSPLNLDTFGQTVQRLVDRHPSLRTSFAAPGGTPIQHVHEDVPVYLHIEDVSTWSEQVINDWLVGHAEEPFDLEIAPLIRFYVLHKSATDHVLLIVMHHIITDFWTIGILLNEIGQLYASIQNQNTMVLSESEYTYIDYVRWQEQLLDGDEGTRLWDYWRQQLRGKLPTLQLSTDRPRPSVQSYEGQSLPLYLDVHLKQDLKALCEKYGTTLFTTLLSIFQVLLYRYTNQSDIIVGAPTNGRGRAEWSQLVGYFVNPVPLRVQFGHKLSFKSFLEQTQQTVLGALDHQDFPMALLVERICPERNASYSPLYQVIFALQKAPTVYGEQLAPFVLREKGFQIELEGLQIESMVLDRRVSPFDIVLTMAEIPDGLGASFEYNTDIFDRSTIARMADHFTILIHSILDDVSCSLEHISLLSPTERHQLLVDWNQTTEVMAPAVGIHTLVLEQAQQNPDRIAIVAGEHQISYALLSQRALLTAQYLVTLNINPEARIALFLDRSVDMIEATLAVLIGGGTYVPLDPDYPIERVAFLLQDAQVAAVLTQEHLRSRIPDIDCPLYCLDGERWLEPSQSQALPSLRHPQQLAYVMYTSGSTGVPKGVSVPHQAIVRLVWNPNYVTLSSDDVFLQLAPSAFDAATLELWAPLVRGARLVLAPSGQQSLADIARLLQQHQVQVLWLTSGLFQQMVEDHCSELATVGQVLAGGDALSLSHVKRLHAMGGQVINGYGPTENTTFTTCHRVPREVSNLHRSVPIGKPITQTQVYIADGVGQLAPIGVPGELYTAGDGLARGYLDRPALTAESFVPDPFSENPGTRLYRTGDCVRYRSDGTIEFLGRVDQQIKLRGFRIELGEIETVMQSYPLVQSALVMLRQDTPGDQRLTAYVVPKSRNGLLPVDTNRNIVDEHIDQWQTLYEETYDEVAPVASVDPTFNIIGWNSSYTSEPIPEKEMRSWVDTTVDRIIASKPQRVLEIGCGTGLLLFPLAKQTSRYVGTDFSAVALDYVRRHLDSTWDHVTLLQQRADALDISDEELFDMVVLNSIVQYFPSGEYLVHVLKRVLPMVASGGRIFVGDVRNLALLEAFATSVALFQASDHTSRTKLWQQVQQLLTQERELLLDPHFFVGLTDHFPEISQVQLEVKRGWAHNELSQFRYDVILTIGKPDVVVLPLVSESWGTGGWSLARLEETFTDVHPDRLYLTQIPNARVQMAVQAGIYLADSAGPTTVGGLRETLNTITGVEPESLWELGAACGYQVLVTWSPEAPDWCEALFQRTETATVISAVQMGWTPNSELESYANQPIWEGTQRTLALSLQEYASTHLPEYMVPATILVLARLPLTPNGKIDRAALPAPDQTILRTGEVVAPRNDMEATLTTIWQTVLGIAPISVTDNFFAIGGHSLLATQVISRIRTTCQVELPIRALFESPTIAELAQVIITAQCSTQADILPILTPQKREQTIPLSFAQQRLWFIEQLHPGTGAYHVFTRLRIQGQLMVHAFIMSLQKIVARHESLRTTFTIVEGSPTQVIHTEGSMMLPVVDLSGISREQQEAIITTLDQQEALRPFDLVTGPLIRGMLICLEHEEYVLFLNQHHIITDGWSLNILVEELSILYKQYTAGTTPILPDLSLQYADYAIWQQQWLNGGVLADHLSYWKEQLADLTILDLPTDYPRPPMPTHRGRGVFFTIAESFIEQLHALSQQMGTSLFMTLLTGWQVVLARYSGQTDIVVGSPIAGRTQTELETLIGFFVNTLVLRTRLEGNPTFREALARVQTVTLDAYAHQELPFEYLVAQLQPERDLSRQPLFQVSFALQNIPLEVLQLSNVTMELEPSQVMVAQFDLALHLQESATGLFGWLAYTTDLFDPSTIERMIGHFAMLLQNSVDYPAQGIQNLALLTPAEQEQIFNWNMTARSYRQECSLGALIAEQALKTPDRVALRFEGDVLSFHMLHQRACQVALYLRAQGVQAETPIGLYVERSLNLLVGVVGVLYAGGAYVPLDPSYPKERLSFLIEDSAVSFILTETPLYTQLQQSVAVADSQIICLDAAWSKPMQHESLSVPVVLRNDHLAYIIYTSGSTGRPKGAMNTHQAIVNRLMWMQDTYKLMPDDRVVQKTPYSFDVSVWELFWPLIIGASLVIAAPGGHQDPLYLGNVIQREQITILHFVPSMLHAFLETAGPNRLDRVRHVICSGEALPLSLQNDFFTYTRARLHNLYGPTEAAVDVTAWQCLSTPDRLTVPIGHPITNTHIYILGPSRDQLPIGVPGELYIGGIQLARGYYQRPGLTAERFVPDPFSEVSGSRMYRTGDLVRYQLDGAIEYLRRLDHQVKLRGFRIELGEIETILREHPAIQDAVVTFQTKGTNDPFISSYVVLSDDYSIEEQKLRDYLRKRLPGYMVPSFCMVLDQLPVTPNGKLDRAALPSPFSDRSIAYGSYEAPQTKVEQTIVSVWQEILGLQHISIHDNFFDLGGHSLALTRVHQYLRDQHMVGISLVDLFRYPTVSALATYLSVASGLSQTTEKSRMRANIRVERTQQQHQRKMKQRREGSRWFVSNETLDT